MRRWFLSYNSQDLVLMQRLELALKQKDPDASIYFAPKRMRAGGFWLPELSMKLADATAFLMLVGRNGVGRWQAMEYYEALARRLDKREGEWNFSIVIVLLDGQPAPGLPFLRQFHWIITPDPASEKCVAQAMDAAAGGSQPPGDLWRHAAPYRGLSAMSESDTDFFFGRSRETTEVIRALATTPNKLAVLLGNSGVGKSSLAQAGVLAAFMRQAWPERTEAGGIWPQAFNDSRHWCVLKLKPGVEPLRALVEAFICTWQFDAVDPERAKFLSSWIRNLLEGSVTLSDLLDATEARYRDELHQTKPPAFLLYIDQGEELYVRAEARQSHRFSDVLSQGIGDPRLYALMSLRADFFRELQKDESLYNVHRQINVPPLREAELREVVSRPAELLAARFESGGLAAYIARQTHEESTKDAGALPLLSYLLDDMWTQMVHRGDGILRLPAPMFELGGVLADHANTFLASNPNSENQLRRILTLKLVTVRENGEPNRRSALRSEFSDEEWRLVGQLADHPTRLLVIATPEAGESYAEVAHEAIFRRWEKLREWIAEERVFLAWRGEVEYARRQHQAAPIRQRANALLMGRSLMQAEEWLAQRRGDIGEAERVFIEESLRNRNKERRNFIRLVGLVPLSIIVTAIMILILSQFGAGLIDSRVQSLLVQGETIAIAIAGQRTESDAINIDLERVLELQVGETYSPLENTLFGFEFSVNPERVAPLVRRLIAPTNTRTRVYDRDGTLILDSRNLYGRGDVLRFDLPPPTVEPGLVERTFIAIRGLLLGRSDLPPYREIGPENGRGYPEVAEALDGEKASVVRINDRGQVIVLVAVPIQLFRTVRGALLLSTVGGEIDEAVYAQRISVLKVSIVVLAVVLLFAAVFAGIVRSRSTS
jgi:hypothetical protein